MATDSQGNTFVFSGSTYTVTSVTVTPGGDLLDNSHLAWRAVPTAPISHRR
jgi:hypothetical protein